jgi:regulator of protease activity HflC (stomatin/prohibitin superfamily)
MDMTTFVTTGIIAVILFMLVSAAVKIVQEYERGVIFRLGRLVAARGPGFFLLIPFVETMRKVDLRIVTLEVLAQEAIPQTMQRAMAKQAEAEREKRAKIIHAEGEFSASQQLAAAAQVIDSQPALQLRYLQTLTEIAAERNSTIVFPLPIDLIQMLLEGRGSGNGKADAADNGTVSWPPAAAA